MKIPKSLKYEPILADNIMYKLPAWNPEHDSEIDFREPFLIMMAFMMLGGLFLLGMGYAMVRFDNEIADAVAAVVGIL